MTQPFADALTWVPKSRALGATLGRAHDLARAKSHAEVTLEHLLLALIEDPDASAVLLAANVDLLALNQSVAAYIEAQPGGVAEMPAAAAGLTAILEYAVAAARQSRRSEINGAIVLAAVVGEGKSEAARMLLAGGLTFAQAVQALKRAVAPRPAPPEPASDAGGASAEPPAPPPAIPLPVPPTVAPQPSASEPTAAQPPEDRPVPQPPLSVAPPASSATGSPPIQDEDPVTMARRRIEAIRSGRTVPELGRAGPTAASQGQDGEVTSWAPPALPTPAAPVARPSRMPPPVPPIAQPRTRTGNPHRSEPANSAVPWSDGEVTPAPADAGQGDPIDPDRLADRIPDRMVAKVGTAVEVRIARSAIRATAVAIGGKSAVSGDAVLARTLMVRLRAPAGGFHIEGASQETQWLDLRAARAEPDELRWRWLVTPHARGRKPLQLSCTMRTVAADGVIVETMLPDAEVAVVVADNLRAYSQASIVAAAAFGAGVALTLFATGGLSHVLRRLMG
jgi:hypothetical protein